MPGLCRSSEPRAAFGLAAILLLASGCALFQGSKKTSEPREELRCDPVVITADPELQKLNDEELFASGSSAFAAQDFRQAARYFDRLADFHPASRHWRAAGYNAGLAHEKNKEWEEALARFAQLSDPVHGTGDELDAAFRVAEVLYHLERYAEGLKVLSAIAARADLPLNRRIEAQVQQGICELESANSEAAEATLRQVVSTYHSIEDKSEVDDYFPAQAQFFLGEIYRLHYESVQLDPERGADQLAKDLEYKAELLLSAQGH